MDITKQVRQLFAKLQDLDAVQLNLENDLGNVRQELRTKATNTKVEQVEMIMQDFSTKTDFVRILNKLESYTTLESFNKMRIAQEKDVQDLFSQMRDLVTKPTLSRELESMKEFVAELNKNNSQKRDCLKDKKETHAKRTTTHSSHHTNSISDNHNNRNARNSHTDHTNHTDRTKPRTTRTVTYHTHHNARGTQEKTRPPPWPRWQ